MSVFAPLIAARAPHGLLRFAADGWSLAYMLFATLLFVTQWQLPGIHWPLVALACAAAYGMGCVQHDQAHLPMWRSRWCNAATECWIMLLRGDGVASWLATHVDNHHRHANRRGDLTLTWRSGPGNHLGNLALYTATGLALYVHATLRHLLRSARRRPARGAFMLGQEALYALFLGLALAADAPRALWVVVVPHAFGVVAMVATGYMQHHHADEESPWDGARNFTGRLNNLLHFNHGYHTVHHLDRTLHWSEWPRAHRLVAARIDPRLEERSLPWYLLRTFLLAPLLPRLRGPDLRALRLARPHPGP